MIVELVYNPVNYFDWTFPGYTNDQLESQLDGLYCPPYRNRILNLTKLTWGHPNDGELRNYGEIR